MEPLRRTPPSEWTEQDDIPAAADDLDVELLELAVAELAASDKMGHGGGPDGSRAERGDVL